MFESSTLHSNVPGGCSAIGRQVPELGFYQGVEAWHFNNAGVELVEARCSARFVGCV